MIQTIISNGILGELSFAFTFIHLRFTNIQLIGSQPSKETMRIMAEYVEEVFKQCRPSVTISGSIRLT